MGVVGIIFVFKRMPLPVETVKEKFGLISVEVTVVKSGVIEEYTAVVMGQ